MCGIAGIVTNETRSINVAAALLAMSKKLRHRGPDDEGFTLWKNNSAEYFSGEDTPAEVRSSGLSYTSEKMLSADKEGHTIGLCHRRLSILDLSSRGHQPMRDTAGKLHITFNGEIYNYIELRAELEMKGHRFHSSSDTEVLLNAYKEWGSDCLQRLNGMWSFVIIDEEKNELFASRDRFGVKPFYYSHHKNYFVFASEIKAIVGLPFVQTGINDSAVYDFFVHNEIEYSPHGFFRNVTELFPGKYIRLNLHDHSLKEESYYELQVNENYEAFDEKKFRAYAEEVKALVYNAVKLRMRSDVKVGSCLSGGIDSSAIGGIMQNMSAHKNEPHFFTAAFPGTALDESVWAKEVVKNGGTWHTTEPTAADLWRDLDALVYGQDLPLWSSSTYAQFSVMKAAKEAGIKVLLDGQGGDELFAGYVPYLLSYWKELKLNGEKELLSKEMNAFTFGKNASAFRLKQRIKSFIDQSSITWLKSVKDPQLKFLNSDFLRENSKAPVLKNEYPTLNGHLKQEFSNTRLKLYLKCEDRCSMWHSVESRTPFADDVMLINRVFELPGTYKIHAGVLKHLLREAVKEFIPPAIFSRKDKMGYVTPHNFWTKNLYADIRDEDFSSVKPYLNYKMFHRNADELYAPNDDRERFLGFKVLTFNRWKKLFSL